MIVCVCVTSADLVLTVCACACVPFALVGLLLLLSQPASECNCELVCVRHLQFHFGFCFVCDVNVGFSNYSARTRCQQRTYARIIRLGISFWERTNKTPQKKKTPYTHTPAISHTNVVSRKGRRFVLNLYTVVFVLPRPPSIKPVFARGATSVAAVVVVVVVAQHNYRPLNVSARLKS